MEISRGDTTSRQFVLVETPDALTRTTLRVLPAGLVLAGPSFSQWAWQYSAEGPFLGAVAGGALGYATHAVIVRLRR